MAYVFQTFTKTGKAHPRWKFEYRDFMGRRCRATGTTSKSETERIAARIEDEQLQIRKGYLPVPKSSVRHAQRPFDEVTSEYQLWGESQGGRGGRPWSRQYATKRRSFLSWWKARLSLDTLADLEGVLPRVEEALRELQAKEKSGKCLQHYAQALQSFCLWAKKRGYLDSDPLDGLATFDTTPKTKRRALSIDEICRLLNAVPEERQLLYRTALLSGLRATELRSLSVADLSTDRGGLTLRSSWTKDRKGGFQPLPADLVEQLRASAEGQPADAPLLHVPAHPDRVILRDFKAAKISQWQPSGKADFHCLRTTFISLVVEHGASVKESMSLARHSAASMTLDVYARARHDRLGEIAEGLGRVIAKPKYPTGTQRQVVGLASPSMSTLTVKRPEVRILSPRPLTNPPGEDI